MTFNLIINVVKMKSDIKNNSKERNYIKVSHRQVFDYLDSVQMHYLGEPK